MQGCVSVFEGVIDRLSLPMHHKVILVANGKEPCTLLSL